MKTTPGSTRPTTAPTTRRRRSRRIALVGVVGVVAAVVAVVPLGGGTLPAAHAAVAPPTIVSLTFDDGIADQAAAVSTLAATGLHGTFFINSGFTNGTGFFTLPQLQSIAAAGNEIGGHTISHPDLTTVPATEAARQICGDRANLSAWGFGVRSFAFPFASSSTALEQTVKTCGYDSARGLGDLRSRFGCAGCSVAETTPPADPFLTRALDEVDSTWTLADLEASVTNAERTGGWVQLTFHHVCDGVCDPLSISPALFSSFAAWLAPRSATNNTRVQTVGDTVGGAVHPVVSAPSTPAAAPGVNGVQNPSLETLAASGAPACFSPGGYGANTPTYAAAAAARTGVRAESLTMAGYSDGDAKFLPTLDLGTCSPTVVPGHTYALGAWYQSTTVTQFAVYLRDASGIWHYWTSSPWFASSAGFAPATWTSPAIPAGSTALSFGLNIFANGRMSTDDYSLYDSVGAPAAALLRTRSVAQPHPVAHGPKPFLRNPLRQGQIVVPNQARHGVRG